MPKRTDIHKILVIGSGPIVIGRLRGYPVQFQPRDNHDRHVHRG